jgi:hypothetical protein
MPPENPFYTPDRKAPIRTPQPGEPLWTLRSGPATWSCELRVHALGGGFEAQILRKGELVLGRRFVLRDEAVGWAERKRRELTVSPHANRSAP